MLKRIKIALYVNSARGKSEALRRVDGGEGGRMERMKERGEQQSQRVLDDRSSRGRNRIGRPHGFESQKPRADSKQF